MKLKILLWSVVSILVIGIALGAFWWSRRPQIILLDNGTKLTLVGVTYGKHHVPPSAKKVAGARRVRSGMAFNTPENSLVIWIRQEHPANQWPQYQVFLYDKAGSACVGNSGTRNWGGGGTNEIIAVQFDSFPRRQGRIILRIQEYIQNEGQVLNEKHFVVSNPARGPFPVWAAEPLPATKTDDDFSATLTKLEFGADANFNRDQDNPDDAINKGVEAVFHLQQNGTNAVNWAPSGITTSDATGNHQGAGCNSHWDGDDLVADYQWGLWANEPAWKLRVEFVKQSGFRDDELLTVTNVPFQPGDRNGFWNWSNSRTNKPFAESTVNGVRVKIYPVQQFSDQMQPSAVVLVRGDSLPEGTHLTVLKIADDQGRDIDHWEWSADAYGLRDIDGVTNLTVTVAVHKGHAFEFTAKPEKN
jgi:hypothetical protein